MNETNAERSFWERWPGCVIKWVVFLPLAFLLSGILQVLPLIAVELARGYQPEINFLTILIAVFVVSIVGIFLIYWGRAVVMTPVFCCFVIAPKAEVAAVVFGALFCLSQASWVFGVIQQGDSWVFVAYHVLFGVLTVFGIVIAYKTPAAQDEHHAKGQGGTAGP